MKKADNFCLLQHDSGTECTPGESKNLGQKENGNYIMYARATSGDKLNNNKFSLCSIRNISQVLEKKRNNCFVGMYFFYTIFFIFHGMAMRRDDTGNIPVASLKFCSFSFTKRVFCVWSSLRQMKAALDFLQPTLGMYQLGFALLSVATRICLAVTHFHG